MPPLLDFIDQIIQEAEERKAAERVEMNNLRADDMLKALAELDGQMSEVNSLCNTETARIEAYRQTELSRLDKKRSWITFNLDAYIRESGEKTIRLPSGTISLRKGRDRIAIVSMEVFLPAASRLGFLKTVPESFEPDQQKIMAYLKRTGSVPDTSLRRASSRAFLSLSSASSIATRRSSRTISVRTSSRRFICSLSAPLLSDHAIPERTFR